MKFRSSTLTPISVSLSMVYQLLQNQNYLQNGKISQSEYNSAANLIYNYISDSYTTFNQQLQENLNSEHSRAAYTSNNITIINYSSNQATEMPLILSSLLFKQMLFSFDLTVESLQQGQATQFNSASLKFSLDNYSQLYQFFRQLSQELKQQITNNMNNIQLFFIIQLICIFLSYIIMQLFEFYFYHQFMHFVKLILRMYESTTLVQIESEMQRLKRIQHMTEGDQSSLIFCYDYDLRAKEVALRADSKKIQQKQEELLNSLSRHAKKQSLKSKVGKEKVNKRAQRNFRIESNFISYKSFFVILIINSIPFFAYIAISLGLIETYTNNFSYALTSYNRFSDAQSYIQTSYILKQQIQNYLPLSEQNSQSSKQIVQQFINSIDEANYFSSSSIDQYISDLQLIDKSLDNDINELISINACQQNSIFSQNIPTNLFTDLISSCEISLNGVLQLGVKAFLSNFIQSMSILIKLNFQNSAQLDQNSDEAIISVIPTKIIEECSNKIHTKLIQVTKLNTIVIFSFGFIFLVTMLITLCYYMIYQDKRMITEYKQSQHVIFLLPTITLLNDETFFKQISYLNMKLQ